MKSHRWFTPYLLVGPAILWVLVFSIWPFLNTVYLSFTNARPLREYHFVAFKNYGKLLEDERFSYAFTTSFLYMLICVPILTLLPLLVALLVQKAVPGIAVFRTTMYFPVIASVVVVGIIWKWIFDSKGLINGALQMLGLTDTSINFLTDRWLILFTAISLTVWKGLGYYMVVYLAALGSVNDELYEAAEIDGAGRIRKFFSVTVPGVRGAMILVAALIAVSAMRIFSELYVLTNGSGGPGGQVQSIVMMIQSIGSGLRGNLGYASAISVVLFLLTMGPLLVVGAMNQGDEIKQAWRQRKIRKAARKIARGQA
ncbi:ABC transporter permease [Boudabousia liubingyangii]|uniref:ABC transporter permease n=1 Tax=Boudabousia liubingyangii TaxID=1921764 RepID=A0A1Q5PQU0_9ACTO|nr:sugar ABC transporter permease [Boudabousia liubingyangii]OKL49770.1 ABC transporter permease [Boudabousia liubingyangii]